jgi:hypothetical protein
VGGCHFAGALAAGFLALLGGSTQSHADAMAQTTTATNSIGSCSDTGLTSAACAPTSLSSASADLATGVLAASASGEDTALNVQNDTGRAAFSDAFTLVLQGYTGTVVPVIVGLTVDTVSLGVDSVVSDQLLVTSYGVANGCQATTPSQFCGPSPPLDNTPLDLSLSLNVSTSDLTVDFSAFLYAQASGPGSSADASDPGQLSISLPRGVTFTSASGVLLTDVQAVPEPSTLSLIVAALAGMVLLRRRKAGGAGHSG